MLDAFLQRFVRGSRTLEIQDCGHASFVICVVRCTQDRTQLNLGIFAFSRVKGVEPRYAFMLCSTFDGMVTLLAG